MRTFAAAGTTLVLLISLAALASAQNPGHPATGVGPGIFSGSASDTWTFPGTVRAANMCLGSSCIATWPTGGTGGTCACPWTTASPGLYYSGSVGVGQNLQAQQICDETGANCKDISAGWSTGGGTCSCQWTAASPGTYYSGSAGIGGNVQVAGDLIGNRICDTETPTTCMDVKGLGSGGGTCTCPTIWGTGTGGVIYYSGGSVGIGTATPNAKMQVYQDSTHWISLDPYYASSYATIRTPGGLYVRAGDVGYTQYMTSSTFGTNALTLGYNVPATATINTYNSGQDLTIAPQGGDTSVTGNLAATGSLRAPQYCAGDGTNCHPITDLVNTAAAADPWTVSGSNIYRSTGNVGIGSAATPAYRLDVSGDIRATGWLRTSGDTGWYSQTWGGGWYMSDTSWIRAYNSKNVWVDAVLGSNGGLTVGYGGATPPSGGAIITGNVGIGASAVSSGLKLDVEGKVGASSYCDQNGANCKTVAELYEEDDCKYTKIVRKYNRYGGGAWFDTGVITSTAGSPGVYKVYISGSQSGHYAEATCFSNGATRVEYSSGGWNVRNNVLSGHRIEVYGPDEHSSVTIIEIDSHDYPDCEV